MTTSNQKVGHQRLTGNPKADWSHAAAYLAGLYTKSLFDSDDVPEDAPVLDQEFRNRLLKAGGVDQLSEEDRALAESLTEGEDVDLSYWPGGENYRVSLTSANNPLGLPGDLWALVEEAEDGALVAGLITPAGNGELDVMVPGGRGWEPLHDLSVIEGYNLVGVNPEAVELFHNYDRDNTLGVISSYPLSATGPFPTGAQLEVRMPKEIAPPRDVSDEFWKNSGEKHGEAAPVTASSTLTSADDLNDFIIAAVENPDLRWYVERRVRALGLEADLPWLEG